MKFCALLFVPLCVSLPVYAQSIMQVSRGIMLFDDSTYGVSFRYPARWTFTEEEPWMFPLSIQPTRATPQSALRGLIYTRSIPRVRSWPRTSFSGVEFGYNVRPMYNNQSCRALSQSLHHPGPIDNVTINGIAFWHSKGGQGGMSQATSDDVYTAYFGSTGGGFCILFDLAIHDDETAGSAPPAPLTAREQKTVQRSLQNVLSSVRISPSHS